MSRYVESYFSHKMSASHHAVVLFVVALLLVPMVFGLFSVQLGAVMLVHLLFEYVWGSWFAFMLASAVALTLCGYLLARGLFELYSFIVFSWTLQFRLRERLSMSFAFIIDFLLSDLVMAAGALVLCYSYLLVSLNHRFAALDFVLLSLALVFMGVFFQVSFMSAYTSAPGFSRVVSASKKFVLTYPTEVEVSKKKRKKR